MFTEFPQMNGPFQLDLDTATAEQERRMTDNVIRHNAVYVSFAWSAAEEAYEACLAKCAKHGLGFFGVSLDDQELVFPDA